MFERRAWWFLAALVLLAFAVLVRLVDIQVVRAAQYSQLVERVSPRQVQYLRAPRGSIRDRQGRVLVCDEPCSDVTAYYRILSEDAAYLRSIARRLRQAGDFPETLALDAVVAQLREQIETGLRKVVDITGVGEAELVERRRQVLQRVARVREAVQRKSPAVKAVREEQSWHALVEDVDPDVALQLELQLGMQPWLKVQPGSRRRAVEADTLAHLLGRLGAATRARIERDPEADDDLRALRGGDRCGVSGVELLAESTLRGTRGRIVVDPSEGPLERISPVRGSDVFLTIDRELQDAVYKLVEQGVAKSPHPAGGAAVVIDVASREVLAAVSVPTYRLDEFSKRYGALIRDTRYMPTRGRAIQVAYPPGSTCKAIAAVGAVADGVVRADTRFHCTGHLLPNQPNRFRCWIYNQFRTTHDAAGNPDGQDLSDAIRNSCNIYFFKVGEKLGPARLCEWFEQFGFGRGAGTGLIEESPGTVPDEAWLHRAAGRRFQRGDEWNWAIGQGEVAATPLQVANVAATVASGVWKPVVLARDQDGAALGPPMDRPRTIPESALRALRIGMWRVANEPGGTAYPQARLGELAGPYVMCGKTGSAQAQPLVLNYRYVLEWPGGQREETIAVTDAEALERFADADAPKIVGRFAQDRYPALGENERLPAHAWFMGYTQARDVRAGEEPRGRVYAISVIIEFGGSGGHLAAPIGRAIAERLLTLAPASG